MSGLKIIYATFLTISLSACSGAPAGASAYCSKQQQCQGGNEDDLRACEARFIGGVKVAAAYKCDALYDAYVECIGANSTCTRSWISTGDACDGQAKSFEGCVEAASALDGAGGGSSTTVSPSSPEPAKD
jgi:hypothetical protein